MDNQLSQAEIEFLGRNHHLIPSDIVTDEGRLVFDIGTSGVTSRHYGPYLLKEYDDHSSFYLRGTEQYPSECPEQLMHDHIVKYMRPGNHVVLSVRGRWTEYVVLYVHPIDGKVLLRHIDGRNDDGRHGWHIASLKFSHNGMFVFADF